MIVHAHKKLGPKHEETLTDGLGEGGGLSDQGCTINVAAIIKLHEKFLSTSVTVEILLVTFYRDIN
jgi:hypothetical protein